MNRGLNGWGSRVGDIGIISLIALHTVPPFLRPGAFFQDDSYFYLQIASNIAGGAGSTFNGITPTNGYHPLWMAGAVLAAFLADGDKSLTLQIAVVMQILLALAAALLFKRLLGMMGLEYGFVGLAAVATYLLGTGIYGSEAHLNALMLTAGMISLWRSLSDDRRWLWFTTGAIFGLAILARLDNVFIVAALGGFGVMHDRRSGAPPATRALAACIGVALMLLPYLAYNAMEYGHLMPISGAIKSTFPVFDFDPNRLGKMGKLAAPFGVVALFIGQFLDDCDRRRVLWRGLGIGVIVHAIYVVGFTDHYTFWAWYYASGVLAAALVATFFPQWIATRLNLARTVPVRGLVIVVTIVVLLGSVARASLKAFNPLQLGPMRVDVAFNQYRWPEEFGSWMKAHLPAESAVFVADWPGALAYYSDRPIVPMDGLVNDFRYNDELLAVGAHGYACAHGLRFVFAALDDSQVTQHLKVTAPLYRKPAGALTLRSENIVARTSDVVRRPSDAPPFAIWRLNCPVSRSARGGTDVADRPQNDASRR